MMEKLIFSINEKLKLLPRLKGSLAQLMHYCNVKDCKCKLCKLFSTSNRAKANEKPKKTAFGTKSKMKKFGRNGANCSRNVAEPGFRDKEDILAKLKQKVALNKNGGHNYRYTAAERRIIIDEYMKRGMKAAKHFGMNKIPLSNLIYTWRKQYGPNYAPLKQKKRVSSIGEKKAIINYCNEHGYENGFKHFKFKNLQSIQVSVAKYKKQLKKQR